ncbi:hypothetical protein Cgig2_001881 [Carnegiea gigantea]|uniref:MADS-box domain-containing protein n=1 Tax=Carnegiea gigantea TaxID=171969 RepID=A0A9Q1K017_9CARY|nr:hypothetical protein Cgig2_001881 [Carnegiea gigantea]
MGRRKLEMGLIESKKTRLRTFTNRKNGIMKKASELSKLCDVDIGVIIFGPNAEKLHVWPQESQKLNHILRRYQSTSQEERRKRAINVFSDGQKTHLIHNVEQDAIWDDHIDRFSTAQLMELISCLDCKLGIVQERIDLMKRKQDSIHVEEVQSYGCENQEMMMVNTSMEPNAFQWEYQPDDHQYVEQRSAEELMMMNGGSFYNLTNGYAGDCTGLMRMGIQGNHENYYLGQLENMNGNGGGMWNPTPLTCLKWRKAQKQAFRIHIKLCPTQFPSLFCSATFST